jgi:peptidoglycan/xylan/chitin deacetylase (PgdA/CDA1 family)
MINIYTNLKKSYRKNLPEFLAFKNKLYPQFIFEKNPKALNAEIPVFTFHTVFTDKFEEQLQFLFNNGYQTLIADEIFECLTSSRPIPRGAVVLTFDDGWKNVYTHGFPLLKKYNMRAVCFLIPGLIDNEDLKIKKSNIDERGPNSSLLCGWEEIREMHQSGLIDFQSHSMYHNKVFTSSIIDDFYSPYYESFAYNFNIPAYLINQIENVSRKTELGTPIYKNASKFSGQRRYFDDENLRENCIEFVKESGIENFFDDINWRKKLFDNVQSYRSKYKDSGSYENEGSYKNYLFNDLLESKREIERQIPGKIVNHFCYPWWEGSETAIKASKEAGYSTNFWGIFADRRTNRAGDDPFKIARILLDDYIFRLPGKGRKSLFNIYRERFFMNANRVKKIF